MSDLTVRHYRKLAQNNRLANFRLHHACAALQPGEFEAARTSFFPSLKETFNHILTVDWFYVDALEGGTLGPKAWDPEEPFDKLAPLTEAQAAVDERLLKFCLGLDAIRVAGQSHMHRTGRIQTERTGDVLDHLFQHQTHHRGQVHAMLASSSIKPPQLDEFILGGGDVPLRAGEMAALGWTESELMD